MHLWLKYIWEHWILCVHRTASNLPHFDGAHMEFSISPNSVRAQMFFFLTSLLLRSIGTVDSCRSKEKVYHSAQCMVFSSSFCFLLIFRQCYNLCQHHTQTHIHRHTLIEYIQRKRNTSFCATTKTTKKKTIDHQNCSKNDCGLPRVRNT